MSNALQITEIIARKDTICIKLLGKASGESFAISPRIPTVCGNSGVEYTQGRYLTVWEKQEKDGQLEVPRFCNEWDTITCQFTVTYHGETLEGVSYVTEVEKEVSVFHEEIPKRSIKSIGLSPRIYDTNCVIDDIDALGVGQSIGRMSLPASMVTADTPNAIPYKCNGKMYYFDKDYVEECDAYLKPLAARRIPVILLYHNDPYYYPNAKEEIVDITIHPDYDYDHPSAYISAFNLRTEEGIEHFIACTEFFLQRYASGNMNMGYACGIEVGNEVNSAYVWNNQGEMTAEGAMKEYTSALRLVWLLSKKYTEHFRVYASFDQCFGKAYKEEPLRYYCSKECIDLIAKQCRLDGDFPWNIATHPYPENLSYPDFWNDRGPRWDFETRHITFKNIEVLPAYLGREELLYKGEPRHIAFTEEGFNTRTGKNYTEQQAKYGYVLAYLKIRKQKTIDIFQYYPYMDNPWEFGLNLGLRYFGRYGEDGMSQIPGEPKPVYEAVKGMDTPDEERLVQEARLFIGEDLFEDVLNPPVVGEKVSKEGGCTIPNRGINNKKGREAMRRRLEYGVKEEQNFNT